MNSKLLIPLCFFIICQAIYDGFGLIQNTNWSIFYFTSQYFAWLLLIILMNKPVSKVKRIPYYALGSGLIVYISIELSNWGVAYLDYYSNVNDFKSSILPISVIIAILTFYIYRNVK